MSELALRVTLVAVGLVHLLPLSGAFGAARLEALYGVRVADPTMLILLQHRAVLFAILGVLIIASSWHRALRSCAIAAALLSMLSFALIFAAVGGGNEPLKRVLLVDLALSAVLALVLAAHLLLRKRV